MRKLLVLFVMLAFAMPVFAQQQQQEQTYFGKFDQLGTLLPTPNEYRAADGSPGPKYWQQKADYSIKVKLDEKSKRIVGEEVITYHNNSPLQLNYLWVQLDQNMRAQNSINKEINQIANLPDSLPSKVFDEYVNVQNGFDGGFNITRVESESGEKMPFMINKTMMRINLDKPLKAGETVSFRIDWHYNINDRMTDGGRSGYEYFPEDDNYLFTIAQFYPRMAAYTDVEGWQNKQFLGQGEFALTFGDFDVEITVPKDHIVAATGTLVNAEDILSKDQFKRFNTAKKTFDKPVMIVTEEEAIKNEQKKSKGSKTWHFSADNVRDFAFASSRKFMWDAMAVKLPTTTPLAMSFYSKEGNPLWEKESTLAVKNTLEVYSERTFDYPYPVAISVHAASIGMEYPMICFNFGRPRPDGSYNDATKYRMIGVIVHEVGHNFFPMIVNSDERQWTWMDEGLNTYLETQTMWGRYPDYTGTWGSPQSVRYYMKNAPEKRPLMTNSDQILGRNFGYNGYGKPAAALNLLRETVVGPELFDYAFKQYAQRWKFKNPTPADFFRTIEDASAVDLDWFWRGWFFTTGYVDISVKDVKHYIVQDVKPNDENATETMTLDEEAEEGDLSKIKGPKMVSLTETPDNFYGEFQNRVSTDEIRQRSVGKHYYAVTMENTGGLLTPLIVEFTYTDGTKETKYVPAEIWKNNEKEVTKIFILDKEVASVAFDPEKKLADTNDDNNIFPRANEESRFDKFQEESDSSDED